MTAQLPAHSSRRACDAPTLQIKAAQQRSAQLIGLHADCLVPVCRPTPGEQALAPCPEKLYEACEMHGLEIMHESRDASEATNWEVCDLSRLIRLRNDLDLKAPLLATECDSNLFSRNRNYSVFSIFLIAFGLFCTDLRPSATRLRQEHDANSILQNLTRTRLQLLPRVEVAMTRARTSWKWIRLSCPALCKNRGAQLSSAAAKAQRFNATTYNVLVSSKSLP